jgi:two-component system osmolarity sensor histidine kinase EnvZ
MNVWRSVHRLRHVLTPRFLKRFVPTSLFGRSLLIILLPVLVMQGAVTWAFFEAHWRTVTAQLSEGLAGDVGWDVALYEANPTPQNAAVIAERAERLQSLSIVLLPGASLPTVNHRSLFPAFDAALRTATDDHLAEPFFIDTTRYPAYIDIRVKVKGGVLRIIAPRDRAFAARGNIFILWLTGATLLLTAVAILFIRNQVRAIERLAEAAEAFGKGDDQRFKPHGAREVRQAGQAFLDMKERLLRHIDQRTILLASVSHDLRTPLTRLKLEAALSPPSPRIDSIKQDLAEMEHMIDEYLAFARGQSGETVESVYLRNVIETVSIGAAHAGATVSIDADESLEASVRPQAFKRALSNLVMNAAAYSRHVAVAAHAAQGGVEIVVDDDGPGIPADRYEEAFRPFSRLDEARNQNVKGVGLGLAIARDMARGHGGDVVLSESPLGGLRAAIRLPA